MCKVGSAVTDHPYAGARSGSGWGERGQPRCISKAGIAMGGLDPAAMVVEGGPGGVRGQQARGAAALEEAWEVLQAELLRLLAQAHRALRAYAL